MLTLARGRSAGRYRARLAARGDIRAAQRLRWRAFRADARHARGARRRRFRRRVPAHAGGGHRDGALVCCFRLMHLPSGAQIGRSYSAQFYELSGLEAFDAPMVEMGRFCIDPDRQRPRYPRVAWAAMTDLSTAPGCRCFRLFVLPRDRGAGLSRRLRAFAGTATSRRAAGCRASRRRRCSASASSARQARPQARHGRDAAASAHLPDDGRLGVGPRGDRPGPRHAACLHGAGDLPFRRGARASCAG
jgi:hypothetical protein